VLGALCAGLWATACGARTPLPEPDGVDMFTFGSSGVGASPSVCDTPLPDLGPGGDEPVPGTADGAWQLVEDGVPQPQCGLTPLCDYFGGVSATAILAREIDGQPSKTVPGATVSVRCGVVGSGQGPFAVHGRMLSGYKLLEISIPAIFADATATAPAAGYMDWLSDDIISVYSGACSFYFEGASEGIGPGKIWASFTCAGLTANGNPPSVCEVAPGYVLFENCATM
jgi:hypothetical protein